MRQMPVLCTVEIDGRRVGVFNLHDGARRYIHSRHLADHMRDRGLLKKGSEIRACTDVAAVEAARWFEGYGQALAAHPKHWSTGRIVRMVWL